MGIRDWGLSNIGNFPLHRAGFVEKFSVLPLGFLLNPPLHYSSSLQSLTPNPHDQINIIAVPSIFDNLVHQA